MPAVLLSSSSIHMLTIGGYGDVFNFLGNAKAIPIRDNALKSHMILISPPRKKNTNPRIAMASANARDITKRACCFCGVIGRADSRSGAESR